VDQTSTYIFSTIHIFYSQIFRCTMEVYPKQMWGWQHVLTPFLFVIQAFLDTLKLKNHPVNFAFLIYKLPSMLMPVSSFSIQKQIIQCHCHPKQSLFKIWTKNAPRVKHLQIKIRGNVLPSIPKGSQSDLILPDGSRIHITKALNTWALPLPPCWMSTLRSNWVSEKHSLWWDTPDISSPTRM